MPDRLKPETRRMVSSAGGHGRAKALSAQRRSEIAKKAVDAREAKKRREQRRARRAQKPPEDSAA